MSWIIPENKLDDQQRDFVENADIKNRNIWIKGFPGSGKSVLLAYTLKKIKRDNPNAKVAVVVFTHSLIKMFQAAFVEMGVSANVMTYYTFMDSLERYDYVLSDEVQDMTPRVLSSMVSKADHVIVAGDENQSIYESDPKYLERTVYNNEILNLLSASSFELGTIHRLSSSIISAVQRFLPSLNVFTAKRDLSKQSTQIRLCFALSKQEEGQYIYKEAKKAINVGQTAAILVPTHECVLNIVQGILESEGKGHWEVSVNNYGRADYTQMNKHLAMVGIPVQYIGNGYGSFSEDTRKIAVMTYHSAKGLDFDNVFLPDLDNTLFISRNENLSKTLFMVAMTRSRNNLYLLYSGDNYHAYIRNFANDCSNINIHDYLSSQSNLGGRSNVFGF